MSFTASWHTLIDELENLPDGAEFITPLSHTRFRVTDIQEHRVVIQVHDSDESRPLQREQFETLYHRIQDAAGGFELDRLPPDADPYPAVLSIHPRFEVDEDAGMITETQAPTGTQLVENAYAADHEKSARTEPEGLDVYSDALLLIRRTALDPDALTRGRSVRGSVGAMAVPSDRLPTLLSVIAHR